MAYSNIDISEYIEFFNRVQRAASRDFKAEFKQFLEACAFEFLTDVQNEIIARKAVDTGLMVNSFGKGRAYNIWEESDTGYEVGSNIEYTKYVNDGHHSSGGGCWIEGKHFWEAAVRITNKKFPKYIQKRFDEWVAHLFD